MIENSGFTIEIDLYRDYIKQIRTYLTDEGFEIAENEDSLKTYIKFVNFRKRRIEARPRNVHVSHELTVPSDYSDSFEQLKHKISNGEDLTPHLSRGIQNIEKFDALLNDWNIHHFHLSNVLDHSTGFNTRTGPILFGWVTDTDFFMIDVRQHGREVQIQPWADEDFIQIIHNNWPHLIAGFKVHGIPGPNYSREQRLQLRKGVTTVVEVSDGTVYAPPGGGITTTGSSIFDTMAHDQFRYSLEECQKYIVENISSLAIEAPKRGKPLQSELKFVPDVSGKYLVVIEINSDVSFEFQQIPL